MKNYIFYFYLFKNPNLWRKHFFAVLLFLSFLSGTMWIITEDLKFICHLTQDTLYNMEYKSLALQVFLMVFAVFGTNCFVVNLLIFILWFLLQKLWIFNKPINSKIFTSLYKNKKLKKSLLILENKKMLIKNLLLVPIFQDIEHIKNIFSNEKSDFNKIKLENWTILNNRKNLIKQVENQKKCDFVFIKYIICLTAKDWSYIVINLLIILACIYNLFFVHISPNEYAYEPIVQQNVNQVLDIITTIMLGFLFIQLTILVKPTLAILSNRACEKFINQLNKEQIDLFEKHMSFFEFNILWICYYSVAMKCKNITWPIKILLIYIKNTYQKFKIKNNMDTLAKPMTFEQMTCLAEVKQLQKNTDEHASNKVKLL